MSFGIDTESAVERLISDVEAVFDRFGSMVPTLLYSAGLLERLDPMADDALMSWGSWEAECCIRALDLVRLYVDDPIGSLPRCVSLAFDDHQQLIRGIAWCLIAEAQDNADTLPTAEAIVSRLFFDRLVEPGTDELLQSRAKSLCIIAKCRVDLLRGQQLFRELPPGPWKNMKFPL